MTLKTMKILSVGVAHAQVLATLHRTGFKEPWSEKTFAETLLAPNTMAFLCVGANDHPMGFVVVRRAAEEAEILTLATHPLHQRKGVARALMHRVEKHLKTESVETLFLEVATDNGAAQALYKALGFVVAGRRKAYYRRGPDVRVDAHVLVKTF